MPFLPIDLDGRENCAKAAAFLEVHPGVLSWGLQETWKHVWRRYFSGAPGAKETADVVPEVVLLGCLGLGPVGQKAPDVLAAFGFLEKVTGGWRVRGAAQWLFGLEGRSRGGKAAKGNLKQYREPEVSRESAGENPPAAPAQPAGSAGSKPAGSAPALTASSQQPAANSEKKQQAVFVQPPSAASIHGADPSIQDDIAEDFKAFAGHAYKWSREDELAVGPILALADHDRAEIRRRWRIGLRARFPTAVGFASLAKPGNWNAWATESATGPPKENRGRATNADKDWKTHTPRLTPDGDVAL